METSAIDLNHSSVRRNWAEHARALAPEFGKRAAFHDESGEFVADNYRALASAGFFTAAIPVELGGGGASYPELCEVVRELAKGCGSTALAFAMHSHPVALNVLKYRRGDAAARATLAKLAASGAVIATTGANDWLESSGTAERVDGGYRITVRKRFVSGSAGAKLLVTSVSHEGERGREVLHFSVPFASEGITVLDNWNTLGMRGTGSHDVQLTDVFVPEGAILLRRSAGEWHPVWEAILPTALPLIVSAYVGLAQQAAELAASAASKRPDESASALGELLNALSVGELALDDMIRHNDDYGFSPSLELADRTLTRKAIAATAVKEVVELAAELIGGAGFFRGHPIERIVCDVRAMHFHPLPTRRQQVFRGRLALGLDPVGAPC